MRFLFLVSFLLMACPSFSQDCSSICPAGAVDEGEPQLGDGYVDMYNGGCYSNPPVFQNIDWTNDEDGLPPYNGLAWLCGTLAQFELNWRTHSDSDWFITYARESGTMEFTVESEYPTTIFKISPPIGCQEPFNVEQTGYPDCGTPATLSFPVTAGEKIYLIVLLAVAADYPVGEFTYFATLSNNTFDTVPAEKMSWGHIKGLYR